MSDAVHFETPENITVSYRLAGPGSRFIACVYDFLLIAAVHVAAMCFFFVVMLAVLGAGFTVEPDGITTALVVSVAIIVSGFLMVGYFIAFEWLMSGQTPGARLMQLRAVMEGGFALTFTAVLIRSIFRLIDNTIPVFWLVPLVSSKAQRFGDMVAGTVMVREDLPRLTGLREHLAARDPSDAGFVFDRAQLGRARPVDLRAAELFLERRPEIQFEHRARLAARIARGISTQLDASAPTTRGDDERFLEDFVAAHARREARELG